MKTLLRNFSYTFRRFFVSSVLNIFGLAIAFASFFVIMTQVDYDYNFNKGYKDYEKIFRLEINDGADWQTVCCRPLGEIISSLPHIEAYSIMDSWVSTRDYEIDGNIFNEITINGFGNFMGTFQPEMLSGTAESLERPGTVIIPRSMALRFFGTADAVGKTIFQGKQADDKPLTIGGVYKDFPENSQVGNGICMPFDPIENKDNWRNWNYVCYVRLDSSGNASEMERVALRKLIDLLPESFVKLFSEKLTEDNIGNSMRFAPLSELHFSKVDNKSASSPDIVYLLLCVSFLIIGVAAINFVNFSLAETPMRIKSINTRKVLGETVCSLRCGLLLESVLVCVIAFALSLVMLMFLHDSGIQELVAADLSLEKHPLLLAFTFGLSVLIGILAGLYPSYYVTSFPPALVLKGSFGLSAKGRMLRMGLVCFQFFVSFALIISIGIMYAQSRYIRNSDYGYDKDAIVTGFTTKEVREQPDAVVDELCRITGVEGAAFSLNILSSSDIFMEWGRGEEDKYIKFSCFPVDWRYLRVMGIRVLEGRDFKPGDGNVYIFNEAAKKQYAWMTVDEPATIGDYPVLGFCENLRFSTFRNDDSVRPMAFFLPDEAVENWGNLNVVNVRVSAGTDKVEVIRSIQKTMEKFTPGHDFHLRFMDEVLDAAYHNEFRFMRQIFLSSLVAIVISIIGVFGLTMFESEYRRKEICIRKIFGSTTGEILRMFIRKYFYMLLGCFVVAVPFGWCIGSYWLENFAEKTPFRVWIFFTSFILVTAVTLLTVTAQSWKTARENPADSIKSE